MLVVKTKPTIIFRGPQNFTTNRRLDIHDIFNPAIQKEVFSYINQLLHEVVELIPTNPDKFVAMMTSVGVFLAAFFKNIPATQAYNMAIEVAKNIPLLNDVSKTVTKQVTIPKLKIKRGLDMMSQMIHTTIYRLLYGIARPVAREQIADVGEYFIKALTLLPLLSSKKSIVGGAGPDEMPTYSHMTEDDLSDGTYATPAPAGLARSLFSFGLQLFASPIGTGLLGKAWNGLREVLPYDNSIRKKMEWVDDHISPETKHLLAEGLRIGSAGAMELWDQYRQYNNAVAAYNQHVAAAKRRNRLAVQDYNTFVDFTNQQNKEIFEKAKRNQEIKNENFAADKAVRETRVEQINLANEITKNELKRLHELQDAANMRGLERWKDFTEDEKRFAEDLFQRNQKVAELANAAAIREAEAAGAEDEVIARLWNNFGGWHSPEAMDAVTGITPGMVEDRRNGEFLMSALEKMNSSDTGLSAEELFGGSWPWLKWLGKKVGTAMGSSWGTKISEDMQNFVGRLRDDLLTDEHYQIPTKESGEIAYDRLTPLDYVHIGEKAKKLMTSEMLHDANMPKENKEILDNLISNYVSPEQQQTFPRDEYNEFDYSKFTPENMQTLLKSGVDVSNEIIGKQGYHMWQLIGEAAKHPVNVLGSVYHKAGQLLNTLGADDIHISAGVGTNNPNARHAVPGAYASAGIDMHNPETVNGLKEFALAYARQNIRRDNPELPYLEQRKNDLYVVKDRVVTSKDAFKEDMGTHGVNTKIELEPDAVHREKEETVQWLKPPNRPEPAIITMPLPFQTLNVPRMQAILNSYKPYQPPSDIPETITVSDGTQPPNQMVSSGPRGRITHIHTLPSKSKLNQKMVRIQPIKGMKRSAPAFTSTSGNLQTLKKKSRK